VSLGSLLTKVGLTLQGHGYGDNSLHSSDNFSLFANPCRRNIQSPPHTKKVELPAYLAPPFVLSSPPWQAWPCWHAINIMQCFIVQSTLMISIS